MAEETLAPRELDNGSEVVFWLCGTRTNLEFNPYTIFGLRVLETNINHIVAAVEKNRNFARDRLLQLKEFEDGGAEYIGDDSIDVLVAAAESCLRQTTLKNMLDARLRRMQARHALLQERPQLLPKDTLRCAACGTENPPTQRFCHHCGEFLWDMCYGCLAVGSAEQNYCGCCGENKEDARKRVVQKATVILQEGHRKWAQREWETALNVWYKVASTTDWRWEEQSQEAVRLWLRQREEWRTKQAEAQRWLEKARHAAERCDWREYVRCLQSVPEECVTAEIAKERIVAEQRVSEIRTLREQLRHAVQRKNVLECAKIADRLLELDPHNARVMEIAQSVSGQVCAAARKYLESGDLQRARALLDLVPKMIRNCSLLKDKGTVEKTSFNSQPGDERVHETFAQLRAQLDDLIWLQRRLENYPNADTYFRRLCLAAYQARLPVGAKYWNVLKTSDVEQCPVAEVTVPSQIRPKVDKSSCLEKVYLPPFLPGVVWDVPNRKCVAPFALAVALAVQGLVGHSASLYTVRPPKLLRWPSRRATSAWGIELSESGWRLARVEAGSNSQPRVVEVAENMEIQQQHSGDLIGQVESWVIQISAMIPRTFQGGLVVSCSMNTLFWKHLVLPTTHDKELTHMVEFETRQVVPIPLEELLVEFVPFLKDEQTSQTSGILVATRKSRVIPICEAIREAFPHATISVVPGPLAVYQMWYARATETHSNNDLENGRAAILHVDWDYSFMLMDADVPWYRFLRVSGRCILGELTRRTGLTITQALSLLHETNSKLWSLKVARILDESYGMLVRDVEGTWQAATRQGVKPPQELRVVGALADAPGLVACLQCGSVSAIPDSERDQ